MGELFRALWDVECQVLKADAAGPTAESDSESQQRFGAAARELLNPQQPLAENFLPCCINFRTCRLMATGERNIFKA